MHFTLLRRGAINVLVLTRDLVHHSITNTPNCCHVIVELDFRQGGINVLFPITRPTLQKGADPKNFVLKILFFLNVRLYFYFKLIFKQLLSMKCGFCWTAAIFMWFPYHFHVYFILNLVMKFDMFKEMKNFCIKIKFFPYRPTPTKTFCSLVETNYLFYLASEPLSLTFNWFLIF